MLAKLGILAFLMACHTSSPSVASGSGSAETTAAPPSEPRGAGSPPPQQQIDAPARAVPPPPQPAAQAAGAGAAGAKGATGATAPGIGEKCAGGDACAAGLECVSYYGFAGAAGPHFKSCEVRCDKDPCPSGRRCVTVADGPGRVCR